VPVAFIALRGAAIDDDALRRYCLEQCGSLRAPARLLVLERLPRSSAGKIAREQLLALYNTALAQQGAPKKA
jgi:acyl-coenzyme A synthetase/AMP-(fatty) acid ligase